jgi:predicted DNA-binding transcriptional regulator AlpA
MAKRLLPDAQVRQRYNVAACTIYRWDHDRELSFPKPIKINGRKYRDEAELDAFDRARAAERGTDAA